MVGTFIYSLKTNHMHMADIFHWINERSITRRHCRMIIENYRICSNIRRHFFLIHHPKSGGLSYNHTQSSKNRADIFVISNTVNNNNNNNNIDVSYCVELNVYIAPSIHNYFFFIEIHFYDMFQIFIDPSPGHISLRRLRYCNVITCRQSLRYYKNVEIVIKEKLKVKIRTL
jgi:hypothetical protein